MKFTLLIAKVFGMVCWFTPVDISTVLARKIKWKAVSRVNVLTSLSEACSVNSKLEA